MIEYFKLALSRYAEFNGRSRRSEYWYFTLVNIILSVIAMAIDGALGMSIVGSILSLALLIPGLAVAIRRLHDIGKSGWWYLIIFTGIGMFVVLYWFTQDSQEGENEWGPNPKGVGGRSVSNHLVEDDLV